MSQQNRIQCLHWLKEIGYQTGTGIMVGSPGQTTDHLIEDIRFIECFRPQMIGIGPFIPHQDTPFGTSAPGSIEQTLRLLSIFRLMLPDALIPVIFVFAGILQCVQYLLMIDEIISSGGMGEVRYGFHCFLII